MFTPLSMARRHVQSPLAEARSFRKQLSQKQLVADLDTAACLEYTYVKTGKEGTTGSMCRFVWAARSVSGEAPSRSCPQR